MGHMLLVIIDAYSKWLMVYITDSQSSMVTIRDAFSRFDLPELIVTDNATCFKSGKFKQFLKANKIRHAWSAT